MVPCRPFALMHDIPQEFVCRGIPRNHATAFFFGMARTGWGWDEHKILDRMLALHTGKIDEFSYDPRERDICVSLWRVAHEAMEAVV